MVVQIFTGFSHTNNFFMNQECSNSALRHISQIHNCVNEMVLCFFYHTWKGQGLHPGSYFLLVYCNSTCFITWFFHSVLSSIHITYLTSILHSFHWGNDQSFTIFLNTGLIFLSFCGCSIFTAVSFISFFFFHVQFFSRLTLKTIQKDLPYNHDFSLGIYPASLMLCLSAQTMVQLFQQHRFGNRDICRIGAFCPNDESSVGLLQHKPHPFHMCMW